MWNKKERKTIYTLNLGRGYPKEITDMTYPLLKNYAHKIGAEFFEVTERLFPEWTPTYEKCQIYSLAQEREDDWALFIDCDCIVHPDMPDVTAHISKDTVLHHGNDLNTVRWKNNRIFQRDGRRIGSPSWFCAASDWCIELYKPMTDMTPKETYSQIFPKADELAMGIMPDRLAEDYVFSYNIAKYGLKFVSFKEIRARLNIEKMRLIAHIYGVPHEEKVVRLRKVLQEWGLL